MKSILIFFLLSVSFVCHAQNILVFGNSSYRYYVNILTAGLDALGYPYTLRIDAALTSSDFDGIDVLIDTLLSGGFSCGDDYTLSIPAIQEFLDNGGASFFMLENGRSFYGCNQQKIENVINPYITSPIRSNTEGELNDNCYMASVLPDDKFCVLDTPNDIAGRGFECLYADDFAGSIDSNSVLAFASGPYPLAEVAAVYGGSDVVVPNGRYIVWSDVNHDFDGADLVVFENLMDYLISGCCDTTTECDGIECGTGACGGFCSCSESEVCVENTCCDRTTECDGIECGTGACGGFCSCSESEVCVENTCCDTTTECDGIKCGTGICGGACPNLCDSTEVCDENTCGCPPGFSRFVGTCLNCPEMFGNCVDCTSTACTRCESNYHLESGQCVADTVFGYENLSQYNFLEESSYSETDNFDPSTISMIEFLISPSSNNFKKADYNDVSIGEKSGCGNLSVCFLMIVAALFLFF